MYIVRKQKTGDTNDGKETQDESQLDKDTILNIKSLMDENVFELLDKTEAKVLSLQRENMELLEELGNFYQEQLTKEEQITVVFDILAQMQRVIEDLIPGAN